MKIDSAEKESIDASIKFLKITLIIFKIFLVALVIFVLYIIINIKNLNKNQSIIDNKWNYFQDNASAPSVQKNTMPAVVDEKPKQQDIDELKAIYQAQEDEIRDAEESAREKYNF